MIDINIYAIVVSSFMIMFLGAMWFSPALFGNQWMAAMGINMNDIEELQQEGKSMGAAYATSAAAAVIISIGMAVMINLLSIDGNLMLGLMLAVGIYFCFNFVTVIKAIVWEERPINLALISGGYELFSFMIAGGIISVWQ